MKARSGYAMRRLNVILAVSVLGCGLPAGTAWAQGVNAQESASGPQGSAADRAALAAQQRRMAESLVAGREAATGRHLDPAYQQWLVGKLANMDVARLQELQSAGLEVPLIPTTLGDSSADLVYTPVTPCRVFDTRSSLGGPLLTPAQQNFLVTGASGFPGQGGNSGGCGIPFGPATSVIVNFAAVNPTGPGNLRAWAVASPQPAAPLAVVVNYSTAMPALANAVAVPICDPSATSCGAGDLRLQADVSSLHVVGDVVGYFRKVDMPAGSETIGSAVLVGGNNYYFGTSQITPLQNVSCLVTVSVDLSSSAANATGAMGIKTARRDVTNNVNTFTGWYNVAPRVGTVSGESTASQNAVWSLTGGITYQFGLYTTVSGDWVGDSVYPTVAWLCR